MVDEDRTDVQAARRGRLAPHSRRHQQVRDRIFVDERRAVRRRADGGRSGGQRLDKGRRSGQAARPGRMRGTRAGRARVGGGRRGEVPDVVGDRPMGSSRVLQGAPLRVLALVKGSAPWNSRRAGPSWPSHRRWSNLYKVSPADGGNPSNRLCRAQEAGCVRMLGWELDHYAPRRVLFLTGPGWAKPFVADRWRDELKPCGAGPVQACGWLRCGQTDVACVIASHPQGKNEAGWAAQVVASFSSLQARRAMTGR